MDNGLVLEMTRPGGEAMRSSWKEQEHFRKTPRMNDESF